MQKLKLKKEYQKYSEYKDSDIKYLGEIPNDWERWKYSFLFQSAMGETILKENLVDDGKIPVYSATEKDKFFGYVNNASVILGEGDLVIPARGNSIGYVKLVKERSTTSQTTIYSKNFKKNKIYSQFIKYYLMGLRKELFYFDQTAIPQITVSQVNKNFISLPPKKDQQKIVEFLDEKTELIDKIVKKKKQLIELLKEKRTAIINQAATKGLDKNVEMKDSRVEWIGKIPKGYDVIKLKYLGNAIIGLTYSPEDVTDESGTLVLRSSNVQNGKIKLGDNVYVNKKIPSKLITRMGDILICSRNGSRKLIGKSACIDKDSEGVSFGAFMAVFRTKHWEFISYFLKSNLFLFQLSSTLTSTINQLTNNNLNNIVVSIPSANEQKRTVEYLNKETEKISLLMQKVEKSINLLNEFKSSLISNVVTGKVRI